MMRLLTVLVPTLYELKKATSVYSSQLTVASFAYAVIPVLKRELRSSLSTICASLVLVAAVAFALIKVLQQAEVLLRQLNNGEALVIGFYGLMLIAGSLSLYFLLSSKSELPLATSAGGNKVVPLKRIPRQTLETVLAGLAEGFENGLAKSKHEEFPAPEYQPQKYPQLVEDRPRNISGFY